jgi:hypothetical protein
VPARGAVRREEGRRAGLGARGPGIVPGAIRNVWIPITSPSVLRHAVGALEPWIGEIDDTIANGILMAALGQRADRAGVWPVVVRERLIALVYADGFGADSVGPIASIVHELAEAFERIILAEKGRR